MIRPDTFITRRDALRQAACGSGGRWGFLAASGSAAFAESAHKPANAKPPKPQAARRSASRLVMKSSGRIIRSFRDCHLLHKGMNHEKHERHENVGNRCACFEGARRKFILPIWLRGPSISCFSCLSWFQNCPSPLVEITKSDC